MRFKTNAKCAGCTAAILKALASLAPEQDWTFDLSSPDKTLSYTGNARIDADIIVKTIETAGFKAEQLP